MEIKSIYNWEKLTEYKYLIALVATFNFLLTPIHIALSGFNPAYVIVINFSLIILGSALIASAKFAKAFIQSSGKRVYIFNSNTVMFDCNTSFQIRQDFYLKS